jgi:hypothetical protein
MTGGVTLVVGETLRYFQNSLPVRPLSAQTPCERLPRVQRVTTNPRSTAAALPLVGNPLPVANVQTSLPVDASSAKSVPSALAA